MGAHGKTYEALLRHRTRLAADLGDMPVPPPPGKRPGESGNLKRQIPSEHNFDPRALKPLVKTLWALSVSLGHLLTAHRQFSRLKSISFSPDGLVGGRGYVMSVKDIRNLLFEASDYISSICDTLYDEVNAPHWKPKLAELEEGDVEDVVKLLDDAADNLDDPEGEAEEDLEEVEAGPAPKGSRFQQKVEEAASTLPDGKDQEPKRGPPRRDKQAAGLDQVRYTKERVQQLAQAFRGQSYSYDRTANSSLPVHALPGPRVDHLDRGEQTGPGGSYNRDEPAVDDGWAEDLFHGKDHTYPKTGESVTPGAWSDDTPTDAWDFGLGYGAKGNGAGGYPNSPGNGKGVLGPASGLPDAPGQPKGDGTAEKVDQATNDSRLPKKGEARLPNDGEKPVARADYYEGFKDNDIDKDAESDLPGEENAPRQPDLTSPGPGYTYERRGPKVLWEGTTPQMRPDSIYERRQGPR